MFFSVGEESGQASKSVARKVTSMQATEERAGAAVSEIARARNAAIERGEKLGQLNDVSEQMRNNAEAFAGSSHDIMMQMKKKKWYQL